MPPFNGGNPFFRDMFRMAAMLADMELRKGWEFNTFTEDPGTNPGLPSAPELQGSATPPRYGIDQVEGLVDDVDFEDV